ncbi:class I SAM-dependent methyltransferase [Porphyrobacter sp. GA68]|uniref:class I SAM-dependent methyltransferase n=1 Tax=Porphyrobacter sp. GA68 TaxID=2883480 RepID=UPI001D182B10|nr:class I SAM-dependent methyltransferase [Porphyrobacter sp. GA68]
MTTKHATGLLPLDLPGQQRNNRNWSEKGALLAWGLIQWPWLLRSLYGGTAASKRALLERLHLPADALPNLGSWKADTFFLHRLVDRVEELRPRVVVELGSGATSLVIAAALRANGGGSLYSFDQHRPFLAEMERWLAEHGLAANFHHAPLVRQDGWPGEWYQLPSMPPQIDLLVVDGPPWTVHPLVRGAAERLFDRLTPGGAVMLDDAARPGERWITRQWRRRWPDLAFTFDGGGSKGLLIGRRHTGADTAGT